MDPVLRAITRVADRADHEPLPPPVDADGVMARIRATARQTPRRMQARRVVSGRTPWRCLAGLAAAAACLALVAGGAAFMAWERATDPYAALALFMDVLS